MGGTEITEYERIQNAMNKAREGSRLGEENATRGSGLLKDDYQNPTGVHDLSTSDNPYGSIDDLANQEGNRVDLTPFKLGGPDGLAKMLITDLSSGIIKPHMLRRYITTNLDLESSDKAAASRIELLAALAKNDPSVMPKIQQAYQDNAAEINEARMKGTEQEESKRKEILEKVLYEHLMDMHQRGLNMRSHGERQRAEMMSGVIERYFSPDSTMNMSTDPGEKAKAIIVSLSNGNMTHEQREAFVKDSLAIMSDMPELRAQVRAEIDLYDDMASSSAKELVKALDDPNTKNLTTALATVLIGKTRGGNGEIDAMKLVLDSYKEKFPGRDFERDLAKAHEKGRISDEDFALLKTLIKDGFQAHLIADVLGEQLESIGVANGASKGSQALVGGIAIFGTFMATSRHKGRLANLEGAKENARLADTTGATGKRLEASIASNPGVMRATEDVRGRTLRDKAGRMVGASPLVGMGLGLAGMLAVEKLEQAANQDNYTRMRQLLSGLSSAQMQQVKDAYSGNGLLQRLEKGENGDLIKLDFLKATRSAEYTQTEKEGIAKIVVEQLKLANSPQEASGLLTTAFNGMDEKTCQEIKQIADTLIQDSHMKPVMVDTGKKDADNKPILEVKKLPDGKPEMSFQPEAGAATTFDNLLIEKMAGADSALVAAVNAQTSGFDAVRAVQTSLAIVGNSPALLTPETATAKDRADFELALRAATDGLTVEQLKTFREEWKKQIDNRDSLASDLLESMNNADVHSEMQHLLRGNDRLWDRGRAHYMRREKADPLATLGVRSGQTGLLSHVDNLERSMRANNPSATNQAIGNMPDSQLSTVDELIEAFHGNFDTQTLNRHLDPAHKKSVELGYNPFTRQRELDQLVDKGTTAQVVEYLENVAGPRDPAQNPNQAQKLELFLETHGRLHLVEQLQAKHPEALEQIIKNSQNKNLQLALKDLIEKEISGVLSDSSLSIDKRAEIAETFYSQELLRQGITQPEVIKDALTAVDIATSNEIKTKQYQSFTEIYNKNAANGGQIGKALATTMLAKPEVLQTIYELTVPIRFDAFKKSISDLGLDLKISDEAPKSGMVKTGAKRGQVELVYDLPSGRKNYAIDNQKMLELEKLAAVIKETLDANPAAADDTRARGKVALEAFLKK